MHKRLFQLITFFRKLNSLRNVVTIYRQEFINRIFNVGRRVCSCRSVRSVFHTDCLKLSWGSFLENPSNSTSQTTRDFLKEYDCTPWTSFRSQIHQKNRFLNRWRQACNYVSIGFRDFTSLLFHQPYYNQTKYFFWESLNVVISFESKHINKSSR